ncbi:unnamed protein product [Prorocentrum cordatum]|uniref:Uncharacterized protein n=1 Tax=Prorocentrum cordatum TaxID=2364126 RepID=A0ABN9T1V2_9DINO|nr:unnamed protein product [Polarella glacialis]
MRATADEEDEEGGEEGGGGGGAGGGGRKTRRLARWGRAQAHTCPTRSENEEAEEWEEKGEGYARRCVLWHPRAKAPAEVLRAVAAGAGGRGPCSARRG